MPCAATVQLSGLFPIQPSPCFALRGISWFGYRNLWDVRLTRRGAEDGSLAAGMGAMLLQPSAWSAGVQEALSAKDLNAFGRARLLLGMAVQVALAGRG